MYTDGDWIIDEGSVGVEKVLNGEAYFKEIASVVFSPGLYSTTEAIKEGACNLLLIANAKIMYEILLRSKLKGSDRELFFRIKNKLENGI